MDKFKFNFKFIFFEAIEKLLLVPFGISVVDGVNSVVVEKVELGSIVV